MKAAIYYIADGKGLKPLKSLVIEEGQNADGPTATLAESADAEPFVRGAPVSTTPQAGFVVLGDQIESEDPLKAAKAAAAALRKKATKAAKTAVNARKAADAAKGKPEAADLVKTAEEADAAAQAADTEADTAEAALK